MVSGSEEKDETPVERKVWKLEINVVIVRLDAVGVQLKCPHGRSHQPSFIHLEMTRVGDYAFSLFLRSLGTPASTRIPDKNGRKRLCEMSNEATNLEDPCVIYIQKCMGINWQVLHLRTLMDLRLFR